MLTLQLQWYSKNNPIQHEIWYLDGPYFCRIVEIQQDLGNWINCCQSLFYILSTLTCGCHHIYYELNISSTKREENRLNTPRYQIHMHSLEEISTIWTWSVKHSNPIPQLLPGTFSAMSDCDWLPLPVYYESSRWYSHDHFLPCNVMHVMACMGYGATQSWVARQKRRRMLCIVWTCYRKMSVCPSVCHMLVFYWNV